MKRLMLKYSILINTLLISCTSNHFHSLVRSETPWENPGSPFEQFALNQVALFNAEFNFRDNNFSGLLAFKRINTSEYKVTLSTKIGVKVFDGLIRDNRLSFAYLTKKLNKPIAKKVLKKILLLLFANVQDQKRTVSMLDTTNNEKIIQSRNNRKFEHYFINNSIGQTGRIEKYTQNGRPVISVEIKYHEETIPQHISMKHHNFEMNLTLTLLARE